MTTLTIHTSHGFPSHHGLLARLRERLHQRAEYARVHNELSALSDRDLADIGLSRSTITDVAAEAARAA